MPLRPMPGCSYCHKSDSVLRLVLLDAADEEMAQCYIGANH